MLTVLLATKDRAQILKDVLEAYCRVRVPESGWKLVVIDNGSTDHTQEVLAAFSNRLPLCSILEPTLGKNFALNSGLNHVEGDLVVLTDDDTFPTEDWLCSLRKSADEKQTFTMFGGVVLPMWAISPPPWVQWVNNAAAYTVSDTSLREGPVEPHHIFGPNMAVRAAVFQSATRFNTTIGPSSSSYAMGSETELLLRLGKQGYKAWFVQDAVVKHFIRKEQLEMPWLFRRGVRFGRGQYRLYGPEQNAAAKLFLGVPLHLARRLLKQALLVAFCFFFRREKGLLEARWRLNVFIGQVQEARIMDREKRSNKRLDGALAPSRRS